MATNRDLPTFNPDSTLSATPTRTGAYGEAYVVPLGPHMAADEGTYFTAITPTPGTGIIGHAAPTTFDEAKPLITLFNNGTKRIYPQFLRMHVSVASVGGARVQFTITTDAGNRRSSAGTAMTVNGVNLQGAVTSLAVAHIGAVVGTAATGARRIHDHIVFRGTIDIIEDVYEISFGGPGGGSMTGSRVATVMDACRTTAPIVIPPNHTMCITQWAGSQSTGPTVQACLGFIER